jgi:molybdopterin molybdotransferase
VLRKLAGFTQIERSTAKVVLEMDIESDGRESYLRATLTKKCGKITATLAGHQGSGNLFSVVKANGLLIIPSGTTFLPEGSEVDAWLLEEF